MDSNVKSDSLWYPTWWEMLFSWFCFLLNLFYIVSYRTKGLKGGRYAYFGENYLIAHIIGGTSFFICSFVAWHLGIFFPSFIETRRYLAYTAAVMQFIFHSYGAFGMVPGVSGTKVLMMVSYSLATVALMVLDIRVFFDPLNVLKVYHLWAIGQLFTLVRLYIYLLYHIKVIPISAKYSYDAASFLALLTTGLVALGAVYGTMLFLAIGIPSFVLNHFGVFRSYHKITDLDEPEREEVLGLSKTRTTSFRSAFIDQVRAETRPNLLFGAGPLKRNLLQKRIVVSADAKKDT